MKWMQPSEKALTLYFTISRGKKEYILRERPVFNYLLTGLAMAALTLCFTRFFTTAVVLCALFTAVSLHKVILFYSFCARFILPDTGMRQSGQKYSIADPREFRFSTRQAECV